MKPNLRAIFTPEGTRAYALGTSCRVASLMSVLYEKRLADMPTCAGSMDYPCDACAARIGARGADAAAQSPEPAAAATPLELVPMDDEAHPDVPERRLQADSQLTTIAAMDTHDDMPIRATLFHGLEGNQVPGPRPQANPYARFLGGQLARDLIAPQPVPFEAMARHRPLSQQPLTAQAPRAFVRDPDARSSGHGSALGSLLGSSARGEQPTPQQPGPSAERLQPDAQVAYADVFVQDLYKHLPCVTNACWTCGNSSCWGTSRCSKWTHHTELPQHKVMCFRDGGDHPVRPSCPLLEVPHGVGRCFNCLLSQEDMFECSFHGLEADPQRAHCKAMKDRQINLLLWLLRSQALRRRFFESQRPFLSNIPPWADKVGSSITAEDVHGYFCWIWDPSHLGRSLLNVDIAFSFLYKTIVHQSVKRRY